MAVSYALLNIVSQKYLHDVIYECPLVLYFGFKQEK